MISDILTFKNIRGWTCGDTDDTLTWNEVEAGRPAPTSDDIAAWRAEYIAARNSLTAREIADTTDAEEVKADNQVQAFLNFTPAQLDAWIESNVTGAGNKTGFKVLGRLAQAAARGRALR